MKLDTIVRSFMIAGLISLLTVLLESAYYGLHPEKTSSIGNAAYSITSPFVSTGINGSINMLILTIIFISTFLIALNLISKKERA